MKNNNSESKVTFPAFIGATIPKDTVVSKKTFFDLSVEYDKIRSSLWDAIGEMKQAVIDRYAEFKPGDKVVVACVNYYGKGRIEDNIVCFISSIDANIPARGINSEAGIGLGISDSGFVNPLDSIPFISYRFNKCKKNGTASLHEQWISMREIISIRLYDPEKDAHLLNQK